MGQFETKTKLIQPKDYSNWNILRFPQISGDGKWYCYWLDYTQEQDTLFVHSLKEHKKFIIPNSQNGQFQPNKNPRLFAFNDNQKGVGILQLKTGNIEWVNNSERFEFSKNGKYLACFSPKIQNGFLKLLDIESNETSNINGVQHFSFDPSGNTAIVVIRDSSSTRLELIRLGKMSTSVILSSIDSEFLYPTWNKNGNALAFIESSHSSIQRLYYFADEKIPVLKEMDVKYHESDDILEISKLDLSFSDDGERVFFWTHGEEKNLGELNPDSVKVQIWKGSDKWIYPRQKLDWEYDKKDRLAVWWPKTKKFFQIGTMEWPEVILSGDQKFSISYNMLTYEPQNRQFPQSDFYITNLESGESKLLLEKMETISGNISMSPNGENIAYFKNKNWWNYNIIKNEHTNVTKNIPFPLYHKHAEHSLYVIPFGVDWTKDNNLLVYDEFDLWKTNIDGSHLICLTDGRNKKISYRKYNSLYDGLYSFGTEDRFNGVDFSEDIIFITCDSLYNYGYNLLKPVGKFETLISGSGKISELRKSKFENSYIFLKEKNNDSPALYTLEGKKSKMLFQSNPHQKKSKIGKTELISYKNDEGEQLHGLLHYPDEYESGKQYPMIVHIYELISHHYQKYSIPGHYNSDGFNYRNYTSEGYFVLEPDILIQKGKPGISATNCVITAVNKVLENGAVNKDAIGLIGHSFGGYETSFIITQTDMFSAAVVGAGVFDIVSSYHTVGENSGRPENWRYENQQWRLGTSFYENKEAYKKNSPLEFAQNIKTPTLIWAGNKDYDINWHQSEAMYLALRRLNMDVELLIYENDFHALTKPQNQKDLTQRICKWFDKYLK